MVAKKLSKNRVIERKILVMFAFYSISHGLFDCFRQLWLQANGFSAIEISEITSLAIMISVVASMLMSFAMDMTRVKRMMTGVMAIYAINMLYMFLISGRSDLGMTIGVVIDIMCFFLVNSAVYPLITMVAKSNKSYNRRRLVGYFAKDFGVVLCSVFTGRMFGSFLFGYEESIIMAFVLALIALLIMFTFDVKPPMSRKTDFYEESQSNKNTNFLTQIGYTAKNIILIDKKRKKKTKVNKSAVQVRTPRISKTFKANLNKYSQFLKYTFSHRIFILYFTYSILATMSYAAVMGLRMLMMIDQMDFTIDTATQYLLYAGLIADIAGVLAYRKFTPKNDYVAVTVKFGLRLLGYVIAIFADNIIISLLAITWGIYTSTIFEGVTDGYYINLVPDKFQFQFNATRTAVRCFGEAVGVWICGLVYHNGPTAMIAASAMIMILQMGLAYRLIYLRQKRHTRRRTASRRRYDQRMV